MAGAPLGNQRTPLILVAEDDTDIRQLIKLYLEGEGFSVLEAENGAIAHELALEHDPDMAILDIMMPEMDGFELTRALRRVSDIPILILSAKDQDNDKILGLNLGADDYLAKPFNPMELVARVKAQLRRFQRAQGNADVITVGALSLDLAGARLFKNGEAIDITRAEFCILAQLMRLPGRIFTKAQLYEGMGGDYLGAENNTMMVHISKLRDKIEDDPRNPSYIITVRGLGYKIER